MNIEVPVSVGELVDKMTILKIKSVRINDSEKLVHVKKELDLLTERLESLPGARVELKDLEEKLLRVNEKLWEIEDDIREKERAREFDDRFIELARAVYVTNDQRFALKNEINLKVGSAVREVKSYKDYGAN